MTIADLYKKLKQILTDSNIALASRGLKQVDSLMEIPERIKNGAGRLALLVSREITEITADDLEGVTVIPDSGFNSCSNFTNIIIPDSITKIQAGAFYNCTNLTTITIPDSVTSIGDSAFSGCNKLSMYIYATTPPSLGSNAIPSSTWIYVPEGCRDAYCKNAAWSSHSSRLWEMA